MARKPTTKRPSPREEEAAPTPPYLLLAVVWVGIITLLFFTSPLPNSAAFETRLDYWFLFPEIASVAFSFGSDSSLASLIERIPYWFVAAVVVVSAVALGDGLLRRLHLLGELPPSLRVAFAGGLGLSVLSLCTLLLGVVGLLSGWIFWPMVLTPIAYRFWRRRSEADSFPATFRETKMDGFAKLMIGVAFPFVVAIVLGASLPSVDFDVREYHLQGPKEFFLNGRVGFLEHNVYTSFPFLTEMLSLTGMVLVGDWWGGAIVGKLILASFGLFAAFAIYGLGRMIDSRAAWFGVVFWLTSPWCYRASTIAYTEGALAYYVIAGFAAAYLAWQQRSVGWWIVTGFLAGSAMSCKYPGLVQAVAPALVAFAAYVVWRTKMEAGPIWSNLGRSLVGFLVAAAFAFGPWALKNLIETGNPVYPLGYSVFGGVDLNDAWAAKWKGGHSPPFNVLTSPIRAVPDFVRAAADVFIKNDWQTPAVAWFAPLALLVMLRRGRGLIAGGAAFTLWLYVMWWALTHRIDRFWVPMLPVTCLLAGIGARSIQLISDDSGDSNERDGLWWSRVVVLLLAVSVIYHWTFIAVGQAGYQHWLSPYEVAKREAASSALGIQLLNEALSEEDRPLLVGEAQVFELKMRPIYNTVFDESIFQRLTSADLSEPDADQRTANVNEFCERLRGAGVTHLFVNWSEVLRYRETYGYTDYVTPKRIADLVDAGVLNPLPLDERKTHVLWEDLNESTRNEIERWGPELHVRLNGVDGFRRFELYEISCK